MKITKLPPIQLQKKSNYSDSGLPDDTGISQKNVLARHIQHDLYMSLLSTLRSGSMGRNNLMELEQKLQELSEWIVNHLK